MVTIRDIAAEVGVSTATVSRALNDASRVGSETRRKVILAADRLNYHPNETARNLAGGRTSSLAVVMPDITNPFFPELVAGVQEVADQHEHMLCLAQTYDDPEAAVNVLSHLRRRRVSGFVVIGSILNSEAARIITDIPHVIVDRASSHTDAVLVQSDNRAGGRLAGGHLISLGHERIALLSGPRGVQTSDERTTGFHDALRQADLEPNLDLEARGDFLEDSGYRAILALRARRRTFTAVFAESDLMAIGALRALDEIGIRVPEDVSVVGFDDIHLAGYIRPGLTTIRQDIAEIGRHATRLLLEPDHPAPDSLVSQDPKRHTFGVQLVRRRSTAPRGQTPA